MARNGRAKQASTSGAPKRAATAKRVGRPSAKAGASTTGAPTRKARAPRRAAKTTASEGRKRATGRSRAAADSELFRCTLAFAAVDEHDINLTSMYEWGKSQRPESKSTEMTYKTFTDRFAAWVDQVHEDPAYSRHFPANDHR